MRRSSREMCEVAIVDSIAPIRRWNAASCGSLAQPHTHAVWLHRLLHHPCQFFRQHVHVRLIARGDGKLASTCWASYFCGRSAGRSSPECVCRGLASAAIASVESTMDSCDRWPVIASKIRWSRTMLPKKTSASNGQQRIDQRLADDDVDVIGAGNAGWQAPIPPDRNNAVRM